MIGLLKLVFLGIAATAIIGRLIWRACEPSPQQRAARLARVSERLMTEGDQPITPHRDAQP